MRTMLDMNADADERTPLPKLIRLVGMSVSSLSNAAATATQPSLADVMEEAARPDKTTTSSRLRNVEAAMDAVRNKYGDDAASFGI